VGHPLGQWTVPRTRHFRPADFGLSQNSPCSGNAEYTESQLSACRLPGPSVQYRMLRLTSKANVSPQPKAFRFALRRCAWCPSSEAPRSRRPVRQSCWRMSSWRCLVSAAAEVHRMTHLSHTSSTCRKTSGRTRVRRGHGGESVSLKNSFNVFTRRIDPFRADADMDITLNDPERDLLLPAIAV